MVSNLDRSPAEVVTERGADAPAGPVVLPYRDVPLGGTRAMPVRRSLPQRARSLIGAWCFVDHYGPDDVSRTGGMSVPGHPHTQLQTASWLFSGEVEHRDTTGVHAFIRPGQLNLMTAGAGIAHSEHSTSATTVLQGVQLWIALPAAHRFAEPGFAHYEPPVLHVEGAAVRVFLGALFGQASPVPVYSPLVGAELTLLPGQSLDLPVAPEFEHGFLCDTGGLIVGAAGAVGGVRAQPGEIVFCPLGVPAITLRGAAPEPTRILLIGGEPLREQIVMWWNFIGRSHEEVLGFRDAWERQRVGVPHGMPGPYGMFPDAWTDVLPAPVLPSVRLRARG